MQYELSTEEIRHIEKYRDLLPEFQAALDKQLQTLFELQTQIMKETFESMKKKSAPSVTSTGGGE